MARRPRTTAGQPATKIRPALRKHIHALGRKTIDGYLLWCRDNGFAAHVEKTREDFEQELRDYERARARRAAGARIHHNPEKVIEEACDGVIEIDGISRPGWQRFCLSIQNSREDRASREALKSFLIQVNDRSKFVTEAANFGGQSYPYIDALIKLNDRRGQWVRPVEDWRPRTHNHRRQFSSLVRHLTARFPVPLFMDQAWFRTDRGAARLRDWFIHIGSGKNIRTANTPIPMTKKMAHFFADAPDDSSIEGAIRWGQVHALGGDRRLTHAILGTRIGETFAHDEFWSTVIKFFVVNPMLERSYVGPIVDFLNHHKFETQEVLVGPGEVEVRPPPHPNLTMRGRTAESLIAQVERWHRELGRTVHAKDVYFKRSGVKLFELRTGKDDTTVWRIRQLLSGAELIDEGRRMNHCVASYADACARGACSIWSMEARRPSGTKKHQTVELDRHGTIVQCRGKGNRLPTRSEFAVLEKWAKAADLTISHYVDWEEARD